MSLLTNYLFTASDGLLTRKPEASAPKGPYSMADSGGVECEVGEFLYGLTRVLKPQRVLTTGIYTGVSDMYIAQALRDNGFGHSWAVEYEPTHLNRAVRLWQNVGVANVITPILESSLAFQPEFQYELMFLDTEPQTRFAELERFFPHLAPGGYVGIHDLPRSFCQGNTVNGMEHWPFGPVGPFFQHLLKSGQLVKFHLPNPRGCVFFYRPLIEDYKP